MYDGIGTATTRQAGAVEPTGEAGDYEPVNDGQAEFDDARQTGAGDDSEARGPDEESSDPDAETFLAEVVLVTGRWMQRRGLGAASLPFWTTQVVAQFGR